MAEKICKDVGASVQTLNCLRCRFCLLEPDTDFKSTLPMIYCAKSECRRIVALAPCPLPNPVTDRTHYYSKVEESYLQTFYQTVSLKVLAQKTQRTYPMVTGKCRRRGWIRGTPIRRSGGSGHWTDAQLDYLKMAYLENWPICTGPRKHNLAKWSIQEKRRQEITKEINRRGPQRSWVGIAAQVHRLQPIVKPKVAK